MRANKEPAAGQGIRGLEENGRDSRAPHAAQEFTYADRLLLSIPVAAVVLGIGRRKLWELVNCGELPAVRIGRRVLLDPADLRAWIETRKTRGPAR